MSDTHETKEPKVDQIWQHNNSGGLYRVICIARREYDGGTMVVYQCSIGEPWVRPLTEFVTKFTFIAEKYDPNTNYGG